MGLSCDVESKCDNQLLCGTVVWHHQNKQTRFILTLFVVWVYLSLSLSLQRHVVSTEEFESQGPGDVCFFHRLDCECSQVGT